VCVFRVQLCVFSRRPFLAMLAAKVMPGMRASPNCDSCLFLWSPCILAHGRLDVISVQFW
jgi:hypothetical protein